MKYEDVVELLKNSVRISETPEHDLDAELQWVTKDNEMAVVAYGWDYRSNRQPRESGLQLVINGRLIENSFTMEETNYLVSLGDRRVNY